MNWKKWKAGLGVSILSGVFTTLAGWAIGLTWKQVLALAAINVGKDGLLYIKSHPVDDISFDTKTITKPTDEKTTP
jgi:hypothetical protein